MDVRFLTASYTASQIINSLDDCCVQFARGKTIGSSVLVTCKSIGATVWRDILFVSSPLATEDPRMEVAHARVFIAKSGGLGVVVYILQSCP